MTKVTLYFQISLPDSDRCSGEKANFILGCHYTNQLNSDCKSKAIERSLGRERKGKSSLQSVYRLLLMWYWKEVLFSPSLCNVLCTKPEGKIALALPTWKLLLLLVRISSGGTGRSRFLVAHLSSPTTYTGCLGPWLPLEIQGQTCTGTHGDTEV